MRTRRSRTVRRQTRSRTALRFGPADDKPPPLLWSLLAGLLILFQVVGVVAFSRPDWDDCFYLAAALDYQKGDVSKIFG